MEEALKYYALDWIAMALSLLGVYLLGKKLKFGFIIFAISNIMWAILGFTIMTSLGIAIGNIVFLIINIKGYINWSKDSENNKS